MAELHPEPHPPVPAGHPRIPALVGLLRGTLGLLMRQATCSYKGLQPDYQAFTPGSTKAGFTMRALALMQSLHSFARFSPDVSATSN